MRLPQLHILGNDAALARGDFVARASALMDALGPAVALHLRGRELTGRVLHDLAQELSPVALRTGALLLVNERVDIALAARCGAHLNARSIPLPEARRLMHNAPLGYSAHTVDEAVLAEVEGADYAFMGTIYATASHPGRAPAGVELVVRTAARVRLPVIAIGGVTPERVPELRAAGAYGAAVIRGVWDAPDPLEAARSYIVALHA